MPPIQHLNPPPNPFWDFVVDMQDHPLFAAYAPQHPQQPRGADGAAAGASTGNAQEQQQANVEDPPEIDPDTLRQHDQQQARATDDTHGRRRGCRGRRQCGSGSDEEGERRRDGHGRRGWGPYGRRGFGGPFGPGFPFSGLGVPPFWAQGTQGAQDGHAPPPAHGGFGAGPHGHHQPPPPGFGPGARGRGGHFHPRGQHNHHGGPPHRHGFGHGPHGASPPRGPPGGFDLGQFLNDLGSRIGMDLNGAAQGLGLDRFMPSSSSPDVDFEPKADIFDRASDYIVHLSLPGAKKSDVGVDWDGEHSVLRIAGVVHRPEVDETMLSQLVVDGRKRETGVFERAIRLGTRRDPAVIDVAGIKAKMTDGVLVVTVPKSERRHEKREVPIAKSQTPSPVRDVEKHVMFDADHDMLEPETEVEQDANIQLPDRTHVEKADTTNNNHGKQAEYAAERNSRESSGTVEAEPAPGHEQLPVYKAVDQHEGSDWENFGSDEEGEYVKINVD